MSRATECLINAGCLQEFSAEQSVRPANRKKTAGFVQILFLWHERSRQRSELRVLAKSPELLQDVGLAFYDVQREGRKPFWKE